MIATLLAILKWLGIIALCGTGLIALLAIGSIGIVFLLFAYLSWCQKQDSAEDHRGDEIPA